MKSVDSIASTRSRSTTVAFTPRASVVPVARARERDLGVVREKRRDEIGRRHDDAVLRTDDRVIAILAVDRETAVAALEPANRAFVAEIPAPIPLQEISADGAHRA